MIIWNKIEDGLPSEKETYDSLLFCHETPNWKEAVIGRYWKGKFEWHSEKDCEFYPVENVTHWTYINFD